MAITYFGHNVDESNGIGNGWVERLLWNNKLAVEYTCPGSGDQLVKAMECYLQANESGNVKVVVYSDAGAKICQATGAYTSGNTGWFGVADDAASISPANTVLTGGTKYILAIILEKDNVYIRAGALISGIKYEYVAGGYTTPPANLPGSPSTYNSELAIRVGVEPAPDPAPTITSLDVTSGPAAGGTAVDITGTGFTATPTVTFGGEDATDVVRVSATHVTCVTPAHAAGAVDVVLTNPDTQDVTAVGAYTYVAAPTITSLDVVTGTTAGGTAVDITGTGFVATPGVTFGGTAATSVVRVSATHVTCKTPAHAAGAVNVVVTNPDTQAATAVAGYEYIVVETPFPAADTYRKLHQSIA